LASSDLASDIRTGFLAGMNYSISDRRFKALSTTNKENMMTTDKATAAEIDDFLESHSEWTVVDNSLERVFSFRNFREAFGFMTETAFIAERKNHHPDWSNVYNRVTVQLKTHDAGGITAKDFDVARQMELIASRR
jgi:4a-hydroxytetrahydrobiopterin dehydratase